MPTNRKVVTCSLCNALFTEPVVHRPCGISFDRKCLKSTCSAAQCGRVIREEDLAPNYTLLNIVDEYRLWAQTVYNLILLDKSTSMWYSDNRFLPFLLGKSRFDVALGLIRHIFAAKRNAPDEKVSLVTFDTSQLQQFDFETINDEHIAKLQTLKPDGKDTALFDAIGPCLERFEALTTTLGNVDVPQHLIILTDGGDNFSPTSSVLAHANQLKLTSKKLHVSGHIVLVGDRNRRGSRMLSDALGYQFHHFNGGNASEFSQSLLQRLSIENDAARASTVTNQEQTNVLLTRLPSVPNTVERVQKRRELA